MDLRGKPLVKSFLRVDPDPSYPQRVRFFFMSLMDRSELSSKTADSAPLLKASIPKLPVPANRSRALKPVRFCPMRLKMASLTLSEVGQAADVIDAASFWVAFSTELDSPNVGQFTAGDLLIIHGSVTTVIPNAVLLNPFQVGYDIGLDGVHFVGKIPLPAGTSPRSEAACGPR